MQQFGASMFHVVVHWHKFGEEESECTLHNFVILVINVPKINKVSKNLTKLWQKQLWLLFSETRWCEWCWYDDELLICLGGWIVIFVGDLRSAGSAGEPRTTFPRFGRRLAAWTKASHRTAQTAGHSLWFSGLLLASSLHEIFLP